jgi:hypothetical protein
MKRHLPLAKVTNPVLPIPIGIVPLAAPLNPHRSHRNLVRHPTAAAGRDNPHPWWMSIIESLIQRKKPMEPMKDDRPRRPKHHPKTIEGVLGMWQIRPMGDGIKAEMMMTGIRQD